jgi:hypothetical protein
MLPGRRTNEGALFVTTSAPDASDPRIGGVTTTPDGVVRVNANAPQKFDQGKGFMNNGALCIDVLGSPIVGYVGGLPVTATGAIKCQVNQPVSPGDSYVGGLRVGPLGGLYVVEVGSDSPPVESARPHTARATVGLPLIYPVNNVLDFAGEPPANIFFEAGTPLPAGIVIVDDGLPTCSLQGTPTVSGTFGPYRGTAENSAGALAWDELFINVFEPPSGFSNGFSGGF